MAVQETPKVGRRSLLAAATGAIAALVGHAVTSPSRALAADHDPVKIGEDNSGSTLTALYSSTSDAFKAGSEAGDGLVGASTASGKSGLYAYSGHANGNGVYTDNKANGNWASLAGPGCAIQGNCKKEEYAGVMGIAGVEDAYGVVASNPSAETSVMLAGHAFGLLTQAPTNRFGIVNVGKAFFSRSGVVTVAKGKRTAKVSSITITDHSYVLATMQYPRSGVYIQAALPNVDTDSITIYLNKAVTVATKVAWFVLDNDIK